MKTAQIQAQQLQIQEQQINPQTPQRRVQKK